jgi:glycosyltransferase involved in cell wall biosynthesis
MRILFICYWGFDDPLTTATALPHLQILQARSDVETIRLVTIERGDSALNHPNFTLPFENLKITFEPLLSPPGQSVLSTKTNDFRRFQYELARQVEAVSATVVIARGAMAGALAYLVYQRTGLPFYVESFEPHANYMREAGVWSWYDPRYLFQKYWESKQKRYAKGIMPVAEHYRRQLVTEGVPGERIVTVPCSVNLQNFQYQLADRERIRQTTGWPAEAIIGIYVGKFGGIYYDKEAFELFQQTAEFFGPNFRLLLLTPLEPAGVQTKLLAAGFDLSHVIITKVPFLVVPAYLSAADFAFGLHRPTPYVSPVKVGEYWASGLPVLLTEGVGDDSDIIKQEGGGAVFNIENIDSVKQAFRKIAHQLTDAAHRNKVRNLAERHRSIILAGNAYNHFFGATS